MPGCPLERFRFMNMKYIFMFIAYYIISSFVYMVTAITINYRSQLKYKSILWWVILFRLYMGIKLIVMLISQKPHLILFVQFHLLHYMLL